MFHQKKAQVIFKNMQIGWSRGQGWKTIFVGLTVLSPCPANV
jgi:hypothetical protein